MNQLFYFSIQPSCAVHNSGISLADTSALIMAYNHDFRALTFYELGAVILFR